MKKILTISIAAYNVEQFLDKALNSLIIDNMDLLEVIIVNDGSKDDTLKIAQGYEEKYPNTFKVIDKKNGGYGSTINTGIQAATGKYFKQLDGDDWYKTDSLNQLCKDLEELDEDIIYTPYIKHYETNGQEIINNIFEGENFKRYSIEDAITKFKSVIEMHSLIYKIELLRENNIKIEENCFYTDTEFAMYPLLYAKSFISLNKPIYVYRLGREGQSVSNEGRKKHYKDHIKVGNNILNIYKTMDFTNKTNLKAYIKDFLVKFLSSGIGNYFLLFKPSKEMYKNIKEYDNDIYKIDEDIYNEMKECSTLVNMIRKNNYFIYKIAYYLRKLKRS